MCKKFIKWTFFTTLVAAGVGFLFFGPSLRSYVSTAYSEVKKAAEQSVPIEFQLKRAKNLIREIDPEIKEARLDVARAEVELENLEREIRRLRNATVRNEEKIRRQRDHLKGNADVRAVSWEAEMTTNRVRRDLTRTFDLHKTQVELLSSKEELIKRQRKILEAARTKLHAVRSEKQKLEDVVVRLDARKRQLDALAASFPSAELDTSSLAEARKLLEKIEKSLDVTERIVRENLYLASGVEIQKDNRDVVAEIDEYFGTNEPMEGAFEDSKKALRAVK